MDRESLLSLVDHAYQLGRRGVTGAAASAELAALVDRVLGARSGEDPAGKLTPREHQVVAQLVAGASTKEIADTLGLTVSTVNTYLKRIFAKLEVHSRIELVALVSGRKS